MASPRGVSVLDLAIRPLRTPFLAEFHHFACPFSLIYRSVPQGIRLCGINLKAVRQTRRPLF